MEEHSRGFTDVRGALERVESRIDRLDQKLEQRIDRLDGRIDRLEDRVARQFVWLVGIQVTTLVAIVGALLVR